jgi:hypothetical protein
MTEDIEQKVPFADETDGKGLAIFRFGCMAILAPAFKIKYAVKIRFV